MMILLRLSFFDVQQAFLVFNSCILKTNFYLPNKTALAFRLDPKFLKVQLKYQSFELLFVVSWCHSFVQCWNSIDQYVSGFWLSRCSVWCVHVHWGRVQRISCSIWRCCKRRFLSFLFFVKLGIFFHLSVSLILSIIQSIDSFEFV
jgi:hypothetical protein